MTFSLVKTDVLTWRHVGSLSFVVLAGVATCLVCVWRPAPGHRLQSVPGCFDVAEMAVFITIGNCVCAPHVRGDWGRHLPRNYRENKRVLHMCAGIGGGNNSTTIIVKYAPHACGDRGFQCHL